MTLGGACENILDTPLVDLIPRARAHHQSSKIAVSGYGSVLHVSPNDILPVVV